MPASMLFGIGLAGAGLLAAAIVPLAEAFGKPGNLEAAYLSPEAAVPPRWLPPKVRMEPPST